MAGIGFRLFIWGNNTTEEKYWKEIYEQEKRYLDGVSNYKEDY